nr:LysM peptidoglycan-binding domain-containing protein [Chloroflexota bacterium]
MQKNWAWQVRGIVERIKNSWHHLLLAGFALLTFLATAWLLLPWQSGNEPTAFFPSATATITRVSVERKPTPTSFIPTATPEPVIHVVQPGEVLGLIAKEYDTTIEAIVEANGLKDTHLIAVGQKLIIAGAKRTPVRSEVFTPTPTPTPTSALPYPAPISLGPSEGAEFHGREARIVLQWASVATLKDGEWYEVKIWSEDADNPYRSWTKASSLVVPISLSSGHRRMRYCWSVGIVYRSRSIIPLSPVQAPRCFYWYLW